MARVVVWLIDSLRLGGAERLALGFCRECDATRWSPRLVVLQAAGSAHASLEASARQFGLRWWCANAKNLRDVSAWRRLKAHLLALQPALLHAHLGYATLWGARLARELDVPLLATLHVLPGQGRGLRPRVIERLQVRCLNARAARVFTLSRVQQQGWIKSGLRAERLAVLPNGVAIPRRLSEFERSNFRARWGLPADAVVFLTVAAVRPAKGWRDWAAVIPRLAASVPRSYFVWVGDGPDATRLQAAVASCARVLLPGFSNEVETWLAASDVFLFPSELEALPTALIEALAAALPAVAFDLPANREVLGDTGLIVPCGDREAFLRAAVDLGSSPSLARQHSAAARLRCLREFSSLEWHRRLYEHYRQTLATHEHERAAAPVPAGR